MEQEDNRPKWLLDLENRKRKPRLAHEAGAGAPCLTCSSACPGLDLHFWRKICKNCKCSRDVHDVDDDEFPQFDLLFGQSEKSKKRSPMRLCVNKKQLQGEATFEWVPPDTTKELATDYMKALPTDKQPIKGSIGAALRKQQLQKQLPLHDIDHKACDELNDQEKKEFEQYLENLKKFVGQGKVIKFMAARPFHRSLMTPANATDVQRFSPQHKLSVSSPSQGANLRTPSSFIQKTSPPLSRNNDHEESPAQVNLCSTRLQTLESSNDVNYSPGRYHRILAKVSHDSNIGTISPVSRGSSQLSSNLEKLLKNDYRITSPNKDDHLQMSSDLYSEATCAADEIAEAAAALEHFAEKVGISTPQAVELSNQMLAEKMLSEALLPPSAIHASDIIGSTLDVKRLTYIRQQLNSKYGGKDDPTKPNIQGPDRINATKKSDLSKKKDEESLLPKDIILDENTKFRDNLQQSIVQHPNIHCLETESTYPIESFVEDRARMPTCFAQNLESKTKGASSSHFENFPNAESLQAKINGLQNVQSNVIHSEELKNPVFPEKMVGNYNSEEMTSVDQLQENMEGVTINASKVQKCHKCHENVNVGDVVVTAEKAKDAVWHPGCFVCSVCNELLADLVYFYYKDKLYCGRDLATLLDIPRCFACDELIFVRKYTVAEGHNYHLKHFCCWDCDMPLAGQQYTSENDRPLCLPCYQNGYAKTCNACNKVIAADHQGVAVKDFNFHATDECFCCFECRKSLLNGRIAIKENRPFCSKECIVKFLNRSL